jgi:hypothetical protein
MPNARKARDSPMESVIPMTAVAIAIAVAVALMPKTPSASGAR